MVGNPPYVRQETIKPFKDFLKTNYETFDGANDLYVYFQEQEIRHLRVEGRMGMIVANKWMRAGYGERLRAYLVQQACPREVVDFGHSPIFPDADTFPCILIASRRVAPLAVGASVAGEMVATCQVPRDDWHTAIDLSSYIDGRRYKIPTRLLHGDGWSLEDPRAHALMDKLLQRGVALREFVQEKQYFGIKSGCNEAFYITEAQRAALIEEDPSSADLIKPLLRGRDIDRWRPRLYPQFLLFVKRGVTISHYPAVLRHLSQFRAMLEPRPAMWDGASKDWAGRKPGAYKWYELQDAVDYYPAFEGPKLVFQRIGFHSRIAFDDSGRYPNDSTTCLPVGSLYCCALLNSHVLWWFMWRYLAHMKDEALFMNGTKLDQIPIADAVPELKEQIDATAGELRRLQSSAFDLELAVIADLQNALGFVVGSGFQLGELSEKVGVWLRLPSAEFVSRFNRATDVRKPSAATSAACIKAVVSARTKLIELLTAQLNAERKLASLVEDAYALTAEERLLLRSTRPIRDPIDVLEAKIRGAAVASADTEHLT